MQVRRGFQRGFSLLETLVSVAILAAAVLGLTSAMLGSTHDTTKMIAHETLTDVASDVLTDLRVASAYQPDVMDALARTPPPPFTVDRLNAAGDRIAIRVTESLTPLASAPGYDVTIVATAPDGHSESLRQTIIQQAVTPGSTVTQAPVALATPNAYAGAAAFPGVAPAPPASPGTAATALPATGNAAPGGLGDASPNLPAADASPNGCIEESVCWPHARVLPAGGPGA